MEKKELTYILGAGASYQSIPLVKTFSSRFREFINSLNQIVKSQNIIIENKTDFFYQLANFHEELKSHHSFDTYFKKLFHKSSDREILLAKIILNLYFLWEHFQPPSGDWVLTDEHGNDINKNNDEDAFMKKSMIDKRYDALIAGLAKPIKGKFNLFAKVNFISWNYDLNLLCSIKSFLSPGFPISQYIDSICSGDNNLWVFTDDLKIINMNGSFYSSDLKSLNQFRYDDFIEIIRRIFKQDFTLETAVSVFDAERISFAWESDLDNQEPLRITEAKNAIARSQTVVVIGYTFPLYNRLVDLKYFNTITLDQMKVLYIQDPNAEQIAESCVTDFTLRNLKSFNNIRTVTNCDSFFVPSNIF